MHTNQTNGRQPRYQTVRLALFLSVLLSLFASCLPKSPTNTASSRTLTVYGFSVMKESLEKGIFPAFAAKWRQEHGEEVKFTSSFAGSETVTNQILQGVGADVAILSIERDVNRLQQGGAVTSDWQALPHGGIINKTPFVILVRKGNPKGIHDFADMGKPGLKLIHPDPVSSGGAMWSVLAIYGSELIKSEKETGQRDANRAQQMLRAIWHNVISTPGSAREARTQFELGQGDALVTYELDAILMKQTGADIEIVVPEATIFSEHPATVIDRNVTAAERPLVDAFMNYLWSDEAQRAFVQYHFRSITDDKLNEANRELAQIKMPFTVKDLGGWTAAYPEIIEHVWRDQVKAGK